MTCRMVKVEVRDRSEQRRKKGGKNLDELVGRVDWHGRAIVKGIAWDDKIKQNSGSIQAKKEKRRTRKK